MKKSKELSEKMVAEVDKKIDRITSSFKEEELSENIRYEYENNVISFIGERGSGKTFTMLSIANLKKNEAFVLDLIEPELFENKTKMLELVITRMYVLFKEKCKNNNRVTTDNIMNLNKKFINILKNIKIYFEERIDYNEKEINTNLFEISNSFDLKSKMKDLVEDYLLVMNKITNKNCSYILLLIDDMDLNYKNAYLVLEQVRKFLIVPKLINFIAYKESQLTLLLENEFFEIEKIDTTQKYLKKLFPYENKIYTNSKQDLINEDKEKFENIEKYLKNIFKNTDKIEDFIEMFYPETYRELIALNNFFDIENSKATLPKYVKFLGGNIINEIDKLKIKKDYLNELFEIEKNLKKDLNMDELKINILKREYILQSSAKVKKNTEELMKYMDSVEANIYLGENNIFYKKKLFEREYVASQMLIEEIKKMRTIKEKDEIIDLVKELFNEKNYIDPLKLLLKDNKTLIVKDAYYYLSDLRQVRTVDEFFKEIINKDKTKQIEKIYHKINSNDKLKSYFQMSLFLNNNFYKKTRCKNLKEIIVLIILLKKLELFELNLIGSIFQMTTIEKLVEITSQIDSELKYICEKIPNTQEKCFTYLKKSNDLKKAFKRISDLNETKKQDPNVDQREIDFSFEISMQNKVMEVFQGIGKNLGNEFEKIGIPLDDWGWIEDNFSQKEIKKMIGDCLGEFNG